MRKRGIISEWHDDRGFGFITPDAGGKRIFVHVSAIAERHARPTGDERVTYALGKDANGRPRAEQVKFADRRAAAKPRRRSGGIVVLAGFLAFVAVEYRLGNLPWPVLAVYGALSLFTFVLYARDKAAARAGRWRTRENTLHLYALLGGWPGAMLAQSLLRHKSSKREFRVVFWMTAVLNCAALGWAVLSPEGTQMMRTLLDELTRQTGFAYY